MYHRYHIILCCSRGGRGPDKEGAGKSTNKSAFQYLADRCAFIDFLHRKLCATNELSLDTEELCYLATCVNKISSSVCSAKLLISSRLCGPGRAGLGGV